MRKLLANGGVESECDKHTQCTHQYSHFGRHEIDSITTPEIRISKNKSLYFFDLDVTLYQLFSSFYSKIGT
jgi:hypothetical protein